MPVLTIASSKGGPGKTTVAMLIAGRLATDGLRVVALDADPSLAFSRWAHNAHEGSPFTALAEADETRLAHLIDTESQIADLVLVDTAGFGNLSANVAMTSADAVLVPALSGEADITEAEKTIRLVAGLARAARRDIPARVLLNRVRRTQLARHAADEIAGLACPVWMPPFPTSSPLARSAIPVAFQRTARQPRSSPVCSTNWWCSVGCHHARAY